MNVTAMLKTTHAIQIGLVSGLPMLKGSPKRLTLVIDVQGAWLYAGSVRSTTAHVH